MQLLRQCLCAAGLYAAAIAGAADLSVMLTDARGMPVADAVVTVLPQVETQPADPTPTRAAGTKTLDQKALAFTPYIETFRPGDHVVFRNSDETRHHVYSFSPIKAFEFILPAGESSAPMALLQTGVIAVGCNIHDSMIAYLYISDAPWIARSGADGQVAFQHLPAGAYHVRVWHPRLPPGKPDLRQSTTLLTATETRRVSFELVLLPDSRRQFDREATRY